jgi:hypothetical protein
VTLLESRGRPALQIDSALDNWACDRQYKRVNQSWSPAGDPFPDSVKPPRGQKFFRRGVIAL